MGTGAGRGAGTGAGAGGGAALPLLFLSAPLPRHRRRQQKPTSKLPFPPSLRPDWNSASGGRQLQATFDVTSSRWRTGAW